MKAENVHHMYTICTPITKQQLCTLKWHPGDIHMYTYIKVFNKGSLLRFLKKIFNTCCTELKFRPYVPFFLMKMNIRSK